MPHVEHVKLGILLLSCCSVNEIRAIGLVKIKSTCQELLQDDDLPLVAISKCVTNRARFPSSLEIPLLGGQLVNGSNDSPFRRFEFKPVKCNYIVHNLETNTKDNKQKISN